jgi:alpha-beta hydrolase superfamily lysophospholipase
MRRDKGSDRMIHTEGKFKTVGGASIYYQSWRPEGESKAILLVVHGLAEHCGRYMNVVNHFVPRGYAVFGLDLPGHGKSDGTRVYADGMADFTNPLKTYFDMVQSWHPCTPIFMLGHSMGGLIGTCFLFDYQDKLKGAVISAPAVKVGASIPPVAIFLAKLLGQILPKLGLQGVDASAVSSDPQVVKDYINDPLVYRGKTTARLGAVLLDAIQRVTAEAGALRLPFIVVQGSADSLVDPDGARMLYDKASSPDKTIKIYDGYYHEVFNEPGRARVLQDVETWLGSHC